MRGPSDRSRASSCARWNSPDGISQTARSGPTEGGTAEPSATINGDVGSRPTSPTTIGPRSRWSDISSISAGVADVQRSAGVIASHRCAAAFPSRSARSRCAHVRVSALYQRNPCRRASRVAIVVLPEPGGPPIQRTCLTGATVRSAG